MLNVHTYDTIETCIAAFYGCEEGEIHDQEKWTWEHNGKITVWGMRRMIRSRKQCGTWGWCEHITKDLHVWVADYAEPKCVIRLLAHEIGHRQRPYKRDNFAEERKASLYEDVALTAFEIMEDIMEKKYEFKKNTSQEI